MERDRERFRAQGQSQLEQVPSERKEDKHEISQKEGKEEMQKEDETCWHTGKAKEEKEKQRKRGLNPRDRFYLLQHPAQGCHCFPSSSLWFSSTTLHSTCSKASTSLFSIHQMQMANNTEKPLREQKTHRRKFTSDEGQLKSSIIVIRRQLRMQSDFSLG